MQTGTFRDEVSGLKQAPILVVQTAFLGDVLLTVPLLKRIRKIKHGAPIYFVGREGVTRVLKELDLIDEAFEVRKNDSASYTHVQNQLKLVPFQLLICPHESFTSAHFCWGIPAQKKVSYRQLWNFPFFGVREKKEPTLPEALRLLSLLESVDPEISEQIREVQKFDLCRADHHGRMALVPAWASASMQDLLMTKACPMAVDDRTICIFPGSVWATKQWTEEGFAVVAEQLIKEGFKVFWMGSRDEIELTKRLAARVPESVSMAGQLSLIQSLSVLCRAKLVVSNDSAGSHLAAVAGAKVVAIFGPTVLDFGFRPWTSSALIVELSDVFCRPCGPHGHQVCPKKTHECMKKIQPRMVLQRIHQLL